MTKKYNVCYNHGRIYCGIADKDKGVWIDADDVTDDAMLSVALYLRGRIDKTETLTKTFLFNNGDVCRMVFEYEEGGDKED